MEDQSIKVTLEYIKGDVTEIKRRLELEYVTKDYLQPHIERINLMWSIFSKGIGFTLLTVLGALLSFVIYNNIHK